MNRIEARFKKLNENQKKAFVVYVGAGDPNLDATRQLALAFDQAGVDILELGVPFSDPLADGVVNQLAAQRGLASGTTPSGVIETVRQIRQSSEIPIVLYLYYNLIYRQGLDQFIQNAAQAGVDGLLVLDLPPEEGADYEQAMKSANLCPIFLVAPTTPDNRIASIVQHARGFIYYVSREGVTGMQSQVAANLAEMTARIRQHTTLPIAVGFGVSNPEQAAQVAANAEGVVVGSAIVNKIADLGSSPHLVPQVASFVQDIAAAIKSQ